jgi:hypothetical protein
MEECESNLESRFNDQTDWIGHGQRHSDTYPVDSFKFAQQGHLGSSMLD